MFFFPFNIFSITTFSSIYKIYSFHQCHLSWQYIYKTILSFSVLLLLLLFVLLWFVVTPETLAVTKHLFSSNQNQFKVDIEKKVFIIFNIMQVHKTGNYNFFENLTNIMFHENHLGCILKILASLKNNSGNLILKLFRTEM